MTARACLLLPEVRENPADLLRLARVGATDSPDAPGPRYTLALALLRCGDVDAAIGLLESTLKRKSLGYIEEQAWLLLSVAYARDGTMDEARRAFDRASQLVRPDQEKWPDGTLNQDWVQWLEFRILRREAEALIQQEPAPAADSRSSD
jgi:tetratricopeptide (TPR) repeat protein